MPVSVPVVVDLPAAAQNVSLAVLVVYMVTIGRSSNANDCGGNVSSWRAIALFQVAMHIN